MKVFKKVFAFAIALTAIAMASSAMAAETEKAVYDNGVVKVALAVSALEGDDQTTVAVVDSHFGEGDPDVDDIYYIDQDTATVIGAKLNTGVGLKLPTGTFTPSTAEVRIGGANKSGYDTHTIPAVVTNNDFVAAPDKTEGEPAGTKRVGHSGTFQFNGGTISKIKFTLSNGPETKVVDTSALGDAGKFTGSLNSVIGTVTFGIEIAGVPTGVDVSLQSVTVE